MGPLTCSNQTFMSSLKHQTCTTTGISDHVHNMVHGTTCDNTGKHQTSEFSVLPGIEPSSTKYCHTRQRIHFYNNNLDTRQLVTTQL